MDHGTCTKITPKRNLMLDFFKQVKEYDSIFFVPHPDDEDQVKIDIALYKEPGEKLDGTSLGDMYDIIIFRLNEEYDVTDLDRFEGILVDPRVYVSRMIKEDWYGGIFKKTTTSKKMSDEVFANWQNMSYNT